MIEKRSKQFVERLSLILIIGAFLGGFIVLLDIKLALTLWGQALVIGDKGFSADAKGMVLQSILIGGFAAVISFWLGTTKQGQEQAQSVSRIAEAAPSVAAAVVAAATGTGNGAPAPVIAGEVNVDATGGDVNIKGDVK